MKDPGEIVQDHTPHMHYCMSVMSSTCVVVVEVVVVVAMVHLGVIITGPAVYSQVEFLQFLHSLVLPAANITDSSQFSPKLRLRTRYPCPEIPSDTQ